MDKLKKKIVHFFDDDSSEYLKHKYEISRDSFMSLRRDKAVDLIFRHLTPKFNENFYFLDAGCGPGILLDFFSKYKINYWGVDISAEMLKLARQQMARNSLLAKKVLLRCDIESLPLRSNSFDAAVSLGVIEYLDGDNRLIAEMARIIKPNGYLLIAVTNKFSYNLLFEKLIEYLRRKRLAMKILNYLKIRLKFGKFKEMEFVKRRHSPKEFLNKLDYYNFKVIDSTFWGFNLFPYPLNYFCGSRLNDIANNIYNKITARRIRLFGEGYLVLCQNNKGQR